jgi:hypothetical protein
MRVTFKVTKNHIKRGVGCNGYKCPVAMALKDAGFKDVAVGYHSIFAGYDGRRWRADNTKRIANFICRFDNRREIKPMKFTLSFSKRG